MDAAAEPVTVASVQRELQDAMAAFEQHVRGAVAKVDGYFRKGAKTDKVSVETKLEDFKQCALLFNSGCKTMLLAVKQVVGKLTECLPTAQKTEELLRQVQQQRAMQKDARRVQSELQRQLDEARADVVAQSSECALLKAEEEAGREELQVARSQMTLLGDHIQAFEQNRIREFDLLERMSCDHEREIAVWQRKCLQALQEVEDLRAEKEGSRGRQMDEKLCFQLCELQQECNRLRNENATLGQTGSLESTPAGATDVVTTPRQQERSASTAVSPVVVSLEVEMLRVVNQLGVAFAERLAVTEGDGRRVGGSGERKKASLSFEDPAMGENTRVSPVFTSAACSVGKTTDESRPGSACGASVTSEKHLGAAKEKPQAQYASPTPYSAEDDMHSGRGEAQVREWEAYVRQMEHRMQDAVAMVMKTINDERNAAEQRLQKELSLRENIYQSQLTTVMQAGKRHMCEAAEALLRCQQLRHELDMLQTAAKKEAMQRELVSDAERRLTVAQSEVFALRIDNEQLRVKEHVLRRQLESMHAVRNFLPAFASSASPPLWQKTKCNHRGSISSRHTGSSTSVSSASGGQNQPQREDERYASLPGASTRLPGALVGGDAKTSGGGHALVSTPRGLLAAGRLDEAIRQLQERLAALDAEVAHVTEAHEVEHGVFTRRLEQLRATLLYWNRDDGAASGVNSEHAAEMRRRSEAEVVAVVEAQRVAQGNITAYCAHAGKKRRELVKVLGRATNMRLALKGQ
ncbi:hypothetical protein TraAM80_03260 [Trypanosoma rangeli]|uniref:Uncharacterized protein n=1 Tax=Trypanosoma rangeli TaxID=5698 RepID=A0A3R7M208_TRYRA|nr:uncharacterized protein TraAM80_03260 [Trypanosoma rangeli]RNF07577.1 hypothetical protein TraAM80_03260 [Trypanosoma rangeli]|eukprot:RNF07577.1 hypothetical protein TraAM80_03260 [Trypanosoma rangeli]